MNPTQPNNDERETPLDKLHDLREEQQHAADMDNVREKRGLEFNATYCLGHSRGANWMLATLKGVPEFDENPAIKQAFVLNAKTNAYIFNNNPTERYFSENNAMALAVDLARWMHSNLAARAAWAEEHAEHFEKEARRVDAIAAKLQERAEAYNVYANEMRDKLTAAELECKQWAKEAKEQAVEFVNMRDKLAAAEARVKELESIIEDIKMRRHSND